MGWFYEEDITCSRSLNDNGSAYRYGEWRKACKFLDLKPIRTLLEEWAHGMTFQTSDERNQWLSRGRYLGINNRRSCHSDLAGLTPRQSLQRRHQHTVESLLPFLQHRRLEGVAHYSPLPGLLAVQETQDQVRPLPEHLVEPAVAAYRRRPIASTVPQVGGAGLTAANPERPVDGEGT